jgi:hypothetical protein
MRPFARRGLSLLLTALSATACGDSVAPEPFYDFGRVTATFNPGALWLSSYFPDSVVAFYEPVSGRLQIQGQEVRSIGSWPTLQIFVGCRAQVGGYALSSSIRMTDNYGAWFSGRVDEEASYLSVGVDSDSVWLEQFDPAARLIQGRFHFRARQLRGTDSVEIEGRFRGHVTTISRMESDICA